MIYLSIQEPELNARSALRFDGGLPRTTKRDTENHGFGMRSVRASLKKYGGELRISAENQLFNVNFLLKKPQA